jgi:hypothetical protein
MPSQIRAITGETRLCGEMEAMARALVAAPASERRKPQGQT